MLRVEAARQIATDRHVIRGNTEIDPDCEVQVVPKGMWVQAWVFVSDKDINAAIEEETAQ
jgi:hypothetical protein